MIDAVSHHQSWDSDQKILVALHKSCIPFVLAEFNSGCIFCHFFIVYASCFVDHNWFAM